MTRSRRWLFAVVSVVMFGLLVNTGCKKSKGDPFPASGTVAGWEKSSDTRVFAAKDLWDRYFLNRDNASRLESISK